MAHITSRARGFAGASLLALATFSAGIAHAQIAGGASATAAPLGAGATTPNAGPTVSGHVYDPSGAALPGVRVVVDQTGAQTTTSLDGGFTIAVPADGDVSLTFDYLSRPRQNHMVAFADRAAAVEITLGMPEGSNEVIVIGSLLDTTARALNQQRQADNTTTILSADAIGRFPDPNIAEALQRAPGIGIERDQGEGRYVNVRGAPAEFSAVTVDGVAIASVDPTTRAVDLDTLPSDIVANLEVSKSLMPDQEADSVAGAINIKTRSPFDRKGLAVNAMAGASYNQFGGTSDYRASGSVSNVFAGRTVGLLLSGSYSSTHRRPDNVENVWDLVGPATNRVFGITETLFKDYDTKRERIAGTAAFEVRPTDATKIWVRGSYARFKDDEYRDRLSIIWTDGTIQPGATNQSATYTNTRIEKQVRHRVQLNEIWTAMAGLEQNVGGGKITLTGAWSKSDQSYPRRDELLFRSTLRPTITYDFSGDADLPRYSLFQTGEHLRTETFGFRENAYRSNTTATEEKSFLARFDAPIDWGTNTVTLSVGGKYRDRDINADEERLRDRRASAAPTQTLAQLLGDDESRNFDYDLGRRFDEDAANAYFDRTKATSERRMPQSVTADYLANEKIMGIFGMLRGQFGDTTVIGGLRVETTDFRASATRVLPNGSLAPTLAKTGYTEFFPNLTLRQAFNENLIGRFALWRGINRPNFPSVVPRALETTDANTVRVDLGNPNLRPMLANNVDAGLEYYIRPLGVISANAFYKDLTDYRYTVTRQGTYLGQAAILTQAENAPEGKLYGIELNWQQQFKFLPGLLGGLGVFANYTYTQADAKLAQAYAGRQTYALPGQSKHMWNAALFYEQGPVNLRVSYTKRSDYLDEVNADNSALDLYWEGRGQLDATASVQLMKGINLFFEGKNLTNSAGVRYYGVRQRVYEYEKFGYSLFGGVRVKL
ncbi:TonB-dependent receptor [Sphingomonas sp.]|uniref:TonB-dependent receptor n=1 Tax=Sphingomonas sp. TaxID=28214 RepID=UPI002DD68FCF|nr:TonB-dependent receptor [Sphingomonas sp.]